MKPERLQQTWRQIFCRQFCQNFLSFLGVRIKGTGRNLCNQSISGNRKGSCRKHTPYPGKCKCGQKDEPIPQHTALLQASQPRLAPSAHFFRYGIFLRQQYFQFRICQPSRISHLATNTPHPAQLPVYFMIKTCAALSQRKQQCRVPVLGGIGKAVIGLCQIFPILLPFGSMVTQEPE